MAPNVIDWPGLKKDYTKWRSKLWEETHKLLTGSGKLELAQYNQVGYFHKVHEQEHFGQMQREWEQFGTVPQEWIAKGKYLGIWTALFDPCNTFSFARLPIFIARFYFKKGYFLFNLNNPSHRETLSSWNDKGKKNPWRELKNSGGEVLEKRLKFFKFPSHKRFFEENNFGAMLVRSDYIACVIFLEDSIERVEFLEIQ